MRRYLPAFILPACGLFLFACGGGSKVSGPIQAVDTPVRALIDNDLAGFVRSVAPADEYEQMKREWQREAGQNSEEIDMPLKMLLADGGVNQLMPMIEMTLAEMNPAELAMQIEMIASMMLMGIADDPESASQLQATLSGVANHVRTSGVNDPQKARKAIEHLIAGLRKAGIRQSSDVTSLPFEQAMAKLKPVVASLKQGLKIYDLDVDAVLKGLTYSTKGEGADREVTIKGRLFGSQFAVPVAAHQVDGTWKIKGD